MKLVDMEGLEEKLNELQVKVVGLEAKVEELKTKVSETKKVNIDNFKESNTYKLALNIISTQFFAKERLKIKWLLRRHHQIKNLSFLNRIANEPTFSSIDKDKEEEEEEKVTQKDRPRHSSLT